ncbi:Alpha-L-arabinofuranosidase 1 [Triticum urartu]|uniref:non-reducing end alpha-L-arabinofuranosidase n=2 Tax=Triticum TaxID=4564 RepID=A0A9R0SDH1_TRITD|nr:Alpha-L-arabinofuranosidase 1 [Triticum urartu]VAH92786.1 unnamed protein product [Triticum turgidum subsp. durum]
MGTKGAATLLAILCSLLLLSLSCGCLAPESEGDQTALLEVDTSWKAARKIPQTLFGLFFENCALGFEAGGPYTPSNIDPWSIIGDESSIYVKTERASCFSRNIVALRMEILCAKCPAGGVGIYNPGFWGMGHGFRKELIHMLVDLKPQFLRFPGGTFVEGILLRNAFRWRETIGPWEERPGHYGDVWNYWTDDGLGYYELLQLAEDLGAEPIWVFNAGISRNDQVDTTAIAPFVKASISLERSEWPLILYKDVLDSLEFARGSAKSTWGSVRAAMGHPERFPLKYVAVGNEDCDNTKPFYQGHYLKFYNAIRGAYPDIQIISNCDGSSEPLDHPADLYDFHIYNSANDLFLKKDTFSRTSRTGPKVFVSEYAVHVDGDTSKGSLQASLAEAAFLIGLEVNSDIVHMASYAPLFVNDNDRKWNPDAIVFNSWQQYGTPSYWMQTFFGESSGAVIHPVRLNSSYSGSLAASAITWQDNEDIFLRIKIVNFGPNAVNLTLSATGLEAGVNASRSAVTVLTSNDSLDENSFDDPLKVKPVKSGLPSAAEEMQAMLVPHSFTSFDLALDEYGELAADM